MSDKTIHLMVGTPCYGGMVHADFATSLMRLQQACVQRGNVEMSVNLLWGDALIPRARQNLVAHFLGDPSTTHLLFIDSDIAFDPRQVFRLIEHDVDLAAGVYPVKKLDWGKVAESVRAGRVPLESASLSYVMELEGTSGIQARNGFALARYAGTGFMLIRRPAFVSMIERYPELRYSREHQADDPLRDSPWRSALFNTMVDPATGTYLSEDFSFCKRWRDMGGKIWLDLESQLTHFGTYFFKGIASTQFERSGPDPGPADVLSS